MQLLMNVSRAAFASFFASAVALHPRMRCCTVFETGVAGTACRGGVAVTGWATVPESAWAIGIASAIPHVSKTKRNFMLKQ
jgi:hypothetical protein